MSSIDSSLSVRRSLRNVVAQSLLSQESTPHYRSEATKDTTLSARLTRSAKKLKLEPPDDESGSSDEGAEEEVMTASKTTGRPKRRRRSSSMDPHGSKRQRHNSGEYHQHRAKQTHVQFPVRRSTREKRLIFATLNTADMVKQIEGQHAYPLYEPEDWMDPYEKLLSPRRVLRRSTRHRHGNGEGSSEGGRISGGQSMDSEDKKEGEDEQEDKKDDEDREDDDSDREDPEDESDEHTDEHSEGEGEVGYYLRKRRPVIYQYQPVLQVVEDDTPPKTRRRRKRGGNQSSYHSKAQSTASSAYSPRKAHHPRVGGARKRHAHHGSSSTSSSGSDSDEAKFRRRKKRSMAKARNLCLPMNFDPEDVSKGGVIRDRARIGASLADVDPMNIDREVTFESVGGHKHHIRALKEMIVFPLLYPEVFERFKISPPRGVLFFGPPGCGKTLMARALANECSKGGKKVAFFMRKGADCLSKWVGESERQLRLLFDQAYQMRPSIIFFDEIDGLAPVRSSRQDQIHSSIVSTLLALMDGLDNRGEIVIIGATNRIDAIDPALRRPGRFDREFVFPLPSREDRLSILSIHTRLWQPQLKPAFLFELASNTVGYCGADLKALCTEAALFALRRKYPQIYNTTQKLVLDVSSINVQASDFFKSLKTIVPTAQRSDASPGRALSEAVRPLFLESLDSVLSQIGFIFPPAWKSVSKTSKDVRCLLEMEDKLSQELKTRLLQSSVDVARLPKSVGKRKSFLHSKKDLNAEHMIERVNHNSVSNWSGAMDQRLMTSGSAKDRAVQNSLFKVIDPETVYFDLTKVAEKNNETQLDSILIEQESTAEDVTQSSCEIDPRAPSTCYLSLSSHPHATPPVYRPRLIICGQSGMGQTSHLAPAILHSLEDLHTRTLDLPALFAVSSKTPEEACTQIFREAKRLAPSVVYLPQISSWWDNVPGSFHATFLSILRSLPSDTPLLVLATAECPWVDLPTLLKELFREVNSEVFTVAPPSRHQRSRFFSTVLLDRPLLPPPPAPKDDAAVVLEELPVAPPPEPRKLTDEELARVESQREAALRELRIFLRDTTNKLLAERKFKEFVKPVDPEEVPDYHEIISQPMDLSTIMRKIDEHRYTTPRQWIADVNLVTMNALEYNPEHDSESRLLRHRAAALQDMANSILDHELSEDFEKQCEEIAETYKRLGKDPSESSPLKKANSFHSQRRHSVSGLCDGTLHTDLLSAPRRSLRQQGLEAETIGFPYYSPPKSRGQKQERADSLSDNDIDLEQDNGEKETSPVIMASQSEPHKALNINKQSLRNSYVRRQIIRPWESKSPSPTSLPNCTTSIIHTEQSNNDMERSLQEPSLVTARNENLVEETLPNQNDGSPKNTDFSEPPVNVAINQRSLIALFERVVAATKESSCEQMERLHATFDHIVFRHRMTADRSKLLEELELAAHRILNIVL